MHSKPHGHQETTQTDRHTADTHARTHTHTRTNAYARTHAHTHQEVMDVTEMDQKPTSSGVRNKQKQNKALALRWKAVHWAARAQAQGWGRVGACSEGTALGGARRRQVPGSARSPPPRLSRGPGPTGCSSRQRKQGEGSTYLVAQKWLVHLLGSVQYLSLNKILVVLFNHELSAL